MLKMPLVIRLALLLYVTVFLKHIRLLLNPILHNQYSLILVDLPLKGVNAVLVGDNLEVEMGGLLGESVVEVQGELVQRCYFEPDQPLHQRRQRVHLQEP